MTPDISAQNWAALIADLRDHYNTDFDTTVSGKEFDAEIGRIVDKHLSEATASLRAQLERQGKMSNDYILKLIAENSAVTGERDIALARQERLITACENSIRALKPFIVAAEDWAETQKRMQVTAPLAQVLHELETQLAPESPLNGETTE